MIKNISVIGGGTMGKGLALTYALNGYCVSLYEPIEAVRNGVLPQIETDLKLMVSEGLLTPDKISYTLDNTKVFGELKDAVCEADYLIEAVPEVLEIKQKLFAEIDKYCPHHTVFATNTSSLRLFDMIKDLSKERQALCLVSHWYNPAHLMPIVELSAFGNMKPEIFAEIYELHEKCDKKPIKILKDINGMIANRILHAQAREVFHLVEIGAASPEDIDKALKYGPGFRSATTGMLETADMGGLDIWTLGEDNMLPDLCQDKKACDLLRTKVKAGHYGLKTGKGFYDYPEEKRNAVRTGFYRRLITQLKASKKMEQD